MPATIADVFVRYGGLAADVGVKADPKDVGQLAEPLRSRIFTVIHDAPNFGLVLVSGRRSPWQQYLLRVERVGASHAFDSRYPGSPRTAIPYSSQHQKGLAADMGGRDLSWLIKNAGRYGLGRTVRSENWHFEAVGTPTYRILPYPGPHAEEDWFTMNDAEAKAAFETVNEALRGIRKTLADFEADRLAPTTERVRELQERIEVLEKDRLEPTTRRVRLLAEKAGIS